MAPLQKSGLYYPNKFGMITIKSLEEGLTRTEKTPEVVVVTHDKGLAIDRRTSCQDNAVKDNIALGDIKFNSNHEKCKG